MMTYEADPRRADIIVKELGVQHSKPVTISMVKDEGGQDCEDEGLLGAALSAKY